MIGSSAADVHDLDKGPENTVRSKLPRTVDDVLGASTWSSEPRMPRLLARMG